MKRGQTALRYAQALYGVVAAEERSQVNDELQKIVEVLSEPDIHDFFYHPKTPRSEKQRAIASMGVHPALQRFFGLLLEKHREYYLPGIAQAFLEITHGDAGISSATVTSAVPLSEAVLDDIRQRLTALSDAREVRLTPQVKHEILGGLVIEMDGKVIDASLTKNIERFRNKLANH